MAMQKFRWSRVYESSEEELVDFLRQRNITAERFVAESDHDPHSRTASTDQRLWCAEGSLSIQAKEQNISLQPGDGIRLEAQTNYTLQPGISGYVCYLSN